MCAFLSPKMLQAGAVKGLMGSFCCPSREFLVLMGTFRCPGNFMLSQMGVFLIDEFRGWLLK